MSTGRKGQGGEDPEVNPLPGLPEDTQHLHTPLLDGQQGPAPLPTAPPTLGAASSPSPGPVQAVRSRALDDPAALPGRDQGPSACPGKLPGLSLLE